MKEVDSCWSWVICVVALVNHALSSGFSLSIGVYYVEFLSVFNENKGTTALISSINVGVLMATGKRCWFIVFFIKNISAVTITKPSEFEYVILLELV